MASPTTGVLDDFNRANGEAGANWANAWGDGTAMVITSNAVGGANAGFSGEYWIAAGSFINGEIWGKVSAPPTGSDVVQFWFRARNPTGEGAPNSNVHGYYLQLGAGTWKMGRYDGGVETVLIGPTSRTHAAGDQWLAQFIGSAITVSLAPVATGSWGQVGATSDVVLPVGWIGLEFQGTVTRIDEVGGGPSTNTRLGQHVTTMPADGRHGL